MTSINRISSSHFLSLTNDAVNKADKKKPLKVTLENIARKAIYILSFKKLCVPPALKKGEIRAIRSFNHKKLMAFPIKKDVQDVEPAQVKQSNKTLEGMHNFTHDLMELTIQCMQEYINPKLKQFNDNEARKIPQYANDIAKEVISIGSLSAKPIFEIIGKYQLNEQAMEKVNKVLKWALKDIKPADESQIDEFTQEFKDQLLERINNPAPEKVPEGVAQPDADQQLNDCDDKILNWLFNSDHSDSPYNLFDNEPHKPSDELITQVLQTSFQILAERKIDLYKNKADDILKDQLPEIVEKTIHDNAIKITDLLSNQMADVLKKTDNQFPVLFDKIVEIVGQHVTHIAESHEKAEQAARDHKALKQYAQSIVERKPKNPKEQKVHDKCQQYLDNLKDNGGINKIKEDVLLKTFLTLSGNVAPCIDSHVTTNISKLIIDILLPPTTKDGEQVKGGLENLLTTIEFPKEFKELFDEAKDIAEMIISEDQFKELKTLGKAAGEFKQLALQGCAEFLTLGLNEAIERTVRHMTKPDEVNLMLTQSALPSATETMIKLFADDLIHDNVKEIAPFFQKLPDEKEEEKLLQFLFSTAQTQAKQFGFTKEHEDTFYRIVKPRINEIVELLTLIKQKDPKKSDLKSTIAVIKEYYKSDAKPTDANPHYLDLIDVTLRTGEFGTLLPRVFKFNYTRDTMSKLLVQSVHSFRQSYRPGLNIAIPIAREKYLQRDYIKELFFQPSVDSLNEDIEKLQDKIKKLEDEIKENYDRQKEEEIPRKKQELDQKIELRKTVVAKNEKHKQDLLEAKRKLAGEVDKMARLGHDMLRLKIKKKVPFFGEFIFKKIVGSSADKISRVALSLINKITGHHAFNEFLLNKILLTSAMGIHKISIATEGTKPLLQDVHVKELDALHVPVSAQSFDTKPLKIKIDKPKKKELPRWKRVAFSAIKRFKNFFKSLAPKKTTLSDHQIKLMEFLTENQIKAQEKPTDQEIVLPGQKKKNKKDLTIQENPVPQENNQEKRHSIFFEEENPRLNGSLKRVGKFVSDFMEKSSNEIFETKIKPWTQFIEKNADQLPQQMNQILDFTNRISAPLADSIIKKISKEGYRTQFDEAARGVLNNLFKSLKGEDETIQEKAMEDLEKCIKKVSGAELLNDEQFENYVAPIRNWIRQPYNQKEEIKSLQHFVDEYEKEINDFAYDEEKVRKFYIAAIQWLVDYKIENHVVGGLQKFLLDKKLSGLIKTHLEKNMQHLSKLLFNLMAERINNVTDEEYKKFFDECAHDINDHIKNLNKAEDQIKDIIKDMESPEEKKEAIEKELTSGKLNDKYEPMYKLHPLAQALLRPPEHLKTDKDIKAYKMAEENKTFESLVKTMMDLALPEGEITVNGKVKQVNAFQELWDNIIIEDEVSDAIDELRQFIKSLMPNKYAEKLDIVESKAKELTKNFILNSLKQYATKALAEKLRESFKLISNADLRREVFVNNFPIVHQLLVKSFADIILSNNEPVKLFKMLIEGEDNPQIHKKLVDEIKKLCSQKFKRSWDELGISEEEFEQSYLPDIFKGLTRQVLRSFILSPEFKKDNLKSLMRTPPDAAALDRISGSLIAKIIKNHEPWNKDAFKEDRDGSKERQCFNTHLQPLINGIVFELKEIQNVKLRDNPHYKLQDKDIEDTLKCYFKGENDQNLQYVEIITNMIKMGNFDNYLMSLIIYVTKNTTTAKMILTKALLPVLHPVRASLRNVTDLAAGGLEAKFLNDDFIKNMINPKTIESLKKKKKKLKHEKEDIDKRKQKPNAPIVELNEKIDTLNEKIEEVKEEIEALQKIKDEEPKRQEEIKEKFDRGLEVSTLLLYDLIEYSAKHATDSSWKNRLAKMGWNAFPRKPDSKALLEASERFYQKFFDNEDLNEALVVKITEQALKLVAEQKDI